MISMHPVSQYASHEYSHLLQEYGIMDALVAERDGIAAENERLLAALEKMVSEPCQAYVEKYGYVQRGQSLFRPDQVKMLLDARLKSALATDGKVTK